MLDINVKTIDGQNRSFSVPENYTVKQFKEKIAHSLSIPVDRQRLIFQGRELKDTSSLNEFDVNGKTLHLVQRIPPVPVSGAGTRVRANTGDGTLSGGANTTTNVTASFDMQNVIQQLIGGLGEFGQNATFNTTTNGVSNGMEVHIDLGNVSQIVNENEIRSRVRNIRRFLTMVDARLNRLNEIQSGAPLDDTTNSTIIVGSIQTTASLTNGSDEIGFETSEPISMAALAGNIQAGNAAGPLNLSNLLSGRSNQPSTITPQGSSSSSTEPAPQAAAAATLNAESNASASATGTNQNISVEVLADLMQNVMSAFTRSMPYLQQYHDMLVNDMNETPESPNQQRNNSSNPSADAAFSYENSTASPAAVTSVTTSSTTTTTTTTRNADGTESVTTTTNTTPETTTTGLAGAPPPPISAAAAAAGPNLTILGGDNRRQRFCNNINDMMHLLGHLFHNLSDLHINIRDRPPRQMHTMSSMTHAASSTIIGAVPVEATIQIPLSMQVNTNIGTGLATAATAPFSATSSGGSAVISPTGGLIGQFSGSPVLIRSHRPRSTQSFNASTNSTQSDQTAGPEANNNSAVNPPTAASQPPPPLPRPFGPTAANLTSQFLGPGGARAPPSAAHLQPSNYSTNNSYDRYLPCNSVHFYNSFYPGMISPAFLASGLPQTDTTAAAASQRRRHPAGDRPAQLTALTTTTTGVVNPTNTAPQSTGQPGGQQQDINRLIANLIGSTIRGGDAGTDTAGNPQQIRVNFGGIPGQISIAAITTTTSNDLNPSSSQANQRSTSQPPPSSTNPSAPRPPPSGANPNDPFAQIGSLLFGGSGGGVAFNLNSAGTAQMPNNFINQILGNLGNMANLGRPAQQPPPPPPSDRQREAAQSAAMGAILREAIGLMDSNNPNDQRLNQPIRDFFRMFGAEWDEEDEEESSSAAATESSTSGSLSTLNLFNVFFSAMSLGDMISLARGSGTIGNGGVANSAQMYQRARQPLRDFICRNVLQYEARRNNELTQYALSSPPTNQLADAQLSEFASRLYTDIFEDAENGLNIDFSRFELVIPKVNLRESLAKLFKYHLKILLEHLFDNQYDQTETPDMWSIIFSRKLHDLIDHVVGLSRLCVRNADAKVTEVALEKLRAAMMAQNFLTSNNGFFGIFETFTRSQIQSVLSTVPPMTRSEFERFLVYVQEETSVVKMEDVKEESTPAATSSLNTAAAMEDDAGQYDSATSTLSSLSMDVDQQFGDAMNQILLKRKTETNNIVSVDTTSISVATSSSGVNVEFPEEWKPIIEHDMESQRRVNQTGESNTTYSDAYMSGMPAKKRKIIAPNDFNKESLFKTVLNRTLKQVQLKPNASEKELAETGLRQTELISEFDAEVDSALNERLRGDVELTAILKSDKKESDETEEKLDDVVYNKNRFALSKKRLN